jgi:outer membrane protein TolC
MSAQVNVAARKEELIAAQGELELAWAELRETMGRPELEASGLKPIEPHGFAQLPLAQELATAAKTRPDLMALGEAQSAQSAAVGAAKSELGPRVSAYGNWEQDQSTTAGAGGDNWVAGVQITVDILPVGKRALAGAGERGERKKSTRRPRSAARASAAGGQPGAHSSADRGTDAGDGASGDGAGGREPPHSEKPL